MEKKKSSNDWLLTWSHLILKARHRKGEKGQRDTANADHAQDKVS